MKSLRVVDLPVWADRFDDDSYWHMLSSGQFKPGILIRVMAMPSFDKTAPGWEALWTVDAQGVITIELERAYVDRIKRKDCAWALGHVLQHEAVEALAAIRLARQRYPDKDPYLIARTCPGNLGGDAHVIACQQLDGLTESEYSRELIKEDRYLGRTH